MIVAIHQPHYLPWLRYIDKIARSDVFVVLDDAQYTKAGWQNRNKIKCAAGSRCEGGWMYLTVPVLAGPFDRRINEVQVGRDQRWRTRHWGALQTNYARTPFFTRYAPVLAPIYQREWTALHELTVSMLRVFLDLLGVRTPLVRSSELGVPGSATERTIAICERLGATTYLTGDYAAANHLDTAAFADRGITVQLQEWECAPYRQENPEAGFMPDLAVVDLLFNEGPQSAAVLRRCRRGVVEMIR
jgi:hypothetical protein